MARDAATKPTSVLLRAVALTAATVTIPRGWTDSVIANAQTNPFLTGQPLWFALGASSTAAASAKARIPDVSATDAAWRYWLMGEDSAYLRRRATATAGLIPAPQQIAQPRAVYVNDQAVMALRFAERRTGQLYVNAFRGRRAAATDDSTRALYAAMLIGMGDSVYSTSDLLSLVLGPLSDERRVAVQYITANNREPLAPPRAISAPDSIATAVSTRVVESLYGNQPLTLIGDATMKLGFLTAPRDVDSIPRFVHMDPLPAAVRERSAALGHPPMPVGWIFQSGTTGMTTHFSAVRQFGPFYSINVTFTTLFGRGNGRSGGYSNGNVLRFVNGPQGWVVFRAASWVT